jgi:hypothetical protein
MCEAGLLKLSNQIYIFYFMKCSSAFKIPEFLYINKYTAPVSRLTGAEYIVVIYFCIMA